MLFCSCAFVTECVCMSDFIWFVCRISFGFRVLYLNALIKKPHRVHSSKDTICMCSFWPAHHALINQINGVDSCQMECHNSYYLYAISFWQLQAKLWNNFTLNMNCFTRCKCWLSAVCVCVLDWFLLAKATSSEAKTLKRALPSVFFSFVYTLFVLFQCYRPNHIEARWCEK